MKLRQLQVNQLKKFDSPVKLENIADGLNIVSGPNEIGKSTLLSALRAVLFENHRSRAKPIRNLMNDRNQAAPVIQLKFDLDDGSYEIKKRFIKKSYARLTCPDSRVLEGDNAEDELRNRLSFNNPNRSGANAESMGTWNVLWVEQGKSFLVLDVPRSARSNLHQVLETEVGNVLGGRRGQILPTIFENQLSTYITPGRGSPRGEYKKLFDEKSKLEDELQKLKSDKAELSDHFNLLEHCTSELEHLAKEDRIKDLQQELSDSEQQLQAARLLESLHQVRESEYQRALQTATNLEQSLSNLKQLQEKIIKSENKIAESESQLTELRNRKEEAKQNVDQTFSQLKDRQEHLSNLEIESSRVRAIHSVSETNDQLKELQKLLEKSLSVQQRLKDSQQQAIDILVSDTVIKKIRQADSDVTNAEIQISSSATILEIEFDPDALDGVTLNERPLRVENTTHHLVEPTQVIIPERGAIRIDPNLQNGVRLEQRHIESKIRLNKELNSANADTLEDAENQLKKKQRFLNEAEVARRELESLLQTHGNATVGTEQLESEIRQLKHKIKSEMHGLELERIPVPEISKISVQESESKIQQARQSVDYVRVEANELLHVYNERKSDFAVLQANCKNANDRLEELRGELESARAQQSEKQLRSKIEAVRQEAYNLKIILSKIKLQIAELNIEILEARVKRLTETIERINSKTQSLTIEREKLISRIESAEGSGLDESINETERQLNLCSNELQRIEYRVSVLKLLSTTLRRAESEAKQQFLSPVIDRVQPYLQYLFPNARIVVDENLQITSVIRQDEYEESFHHLSLGTQEQIAVLIRLAFAELLVEQNQPAAVILDDALAYSDDDRIKNMFDILQKASDKVQVIVLTCRAHLFDQLGAQRLVLEEGNIEEVQSA